LFIVLTSLRRSVGGDYSQRGSSSGDDRLFAFLKEHVMLLLRDEKGGEL
jgi:hypothetical protein